MTLIIKKTSMNLQQTLGWWKDPNGHVMFKDNTGHVGTLEDHEINYDGKVTPSVECERCNFHEMIFLEGYDKN